MKRMCSGDLQQTERAGFGLMGRAEPLQETRIRGSHGKDDGKYGVGGNVIFKLG